MVRDFVTREQFLESGRKLVKILYYLVKTEVLTLNIKESPL